MEAPMRDINSNQKNINVFKGNVNIKANQGNIVYGTQIINKSMEEKDKIIYDIQKGRLSLNRKLLVNTGGSLSIVGILGLISSVITIVQSLGKGQLPQINLITSITMFSILIGLSILHLAIELKRKKLVSVFSKYIFGFNLALLKDGKVARLKLTGICPKNNCGGKLRFYYSVEEDKYYFVCSRNSSQHRYEFDFTLLEY